MRRFSRGAMACRYCKRKRFLVLKWTCGDLSFWACPRHTLSAWAELEARTKHEG